MSAYVAAPECVTLTRVFLENHNWIRPVISHTVGSKTVVAAYSETLPPNVLMDTTTRADANVNAIATALVVKSYGGPKDPDTPVLYPRLVVMCYAPTRAMARALANLVGAVLHDTTLDSSSVRVVYQQSALPIVDVEEPTKFPFADVHFNCVLL